MKKIWIFIAAIALTWGSVSEAKIYIAEPYLVDQSAYSGSEFYVYRPHGIPKGWFVTFDGFAVTKTKGEVWVYGTIHGGEPVATNYIVGTVQPALAGILPYYAQATPTNPVQGMEIAKQPVGPGANQVPKQAYMPQWALDPSFMAIGKWRGSIDRVGVLQPLNVPIAWKGEYPRVLFVWLGKGWHQIEVREDKTFTEALKLNLYALTKSRSRNVFNWYREDTALLTEKTVGWGYYWMGEIAVR